MTTRTEREQHVTQMLTNMRLEGMLPDDAHLRLLQGYIEGTVTLDDLLNYARAYAVAYRSRPSDDGGTYFLLPRDEHLFPESESTDPASEKSELEKLRLWYEKNRPAREPTDPERAAALEEILRGIGM